MMAISAALVNELRKKTGAGMMDCKKALEESNGDFDKAIEYLRKKGAAVAAKRADKVANEGLIATKVSENNNYGVIVEVNCETDFVAKSEDFVNFVNHIVNKAVESKVFNVEELVEKNPDVTVLLNEVMGKVGEKTEIRRLAAFNVENGFVVDYLHTGSKLGVLVCFENVNSITPELTSLAKDISMQVAAMNPICVYREDVPKDLIEKEIEIYKEMARREGKPENILDKIAQGRLNKYYQENCLIEQAFVRDNTKTIGDLISDFNKNHNTQIRISQFKRFQLGEEKK
ncbi:MAG: translation elongation factor Ts [Ignavibacteriales bacterium]|nr:translation elongation factor Ts [Ignavibacteriales bacterium]